jgi:hypothetical protein
MLKAFKVLNMLKMLNMLRVFTHRATVGGLAPPKH